MQFKSTVPSSPSQISRFALNSLAAAALACAAFTLPAFAQTAAPTTPHDASASQPLQAQHTGERDAQHEQWQQKRAERRAQRLAQLHEKLALTPAQEGAWASFAQAMQPSARNMPRLDRQAMQQLTTPERIDHMTALRAQRSAAMDARGEATKAFYAQLQPAQQQTFDQARPMGMGHGHRMGHRGSGKGDARDPKNAG